ncbi:hypothetical protein CCACVL1_04359 [Corchorus capsularis]|uniref:Uncharacterized protein n=1 Tax=Corchorus capsularis TaxID=210143 RepID=A0A1R3JT72_COCAP|nr:hypothetical protein CCACVL1_04359 [Corchorus capsularis]
MDREIRHIMKRSTPALEKDQSYRPIIENNGPIIENFLRQHVITHKTLRALRTRCSNLHNQLIKNRLTVARAISDGEMDDEAKHPRDAEVLGFSYEPEGDSSRLVINYLNGEE